MKRPKASRKRTDNTECMFMNEKFCNGLNKAKKLCYNKAKLNEISGTEEEKKMKKFRVFVCLWMIAAFLLPVCATAQVQLLSDASTTMYPLPEEGISHFVFAYTGGGWFPENELKLEFTQGMLVYNKERGRDFTEAGWAYPAVEIKVWRWNHDTMRWEQENEKYDIYNKRKNTVKLEEKESIYCVQMYFWNPDTVAKSYYEHGEFYLVSDFLDNFDLNPLVYAPTEGKWDKKHMPSVTVTTGDDTQLFTENPYSFLPNEQ